VWDNETMNKPAEAFTDLFDPAQHLPDGIGEILNHQTDLPRIAKDKKLIAAIEARLEQLPTRHDLYRADSRTIDFLAPETVQLVVTSPPYWTLKDYNLNEAQLADYDKFLDELDRVWKACFNALVPGGRLICVVGDVCLSRRKNKGQHLVMPTSRASCCLCSSWKRTAGFGS
jgi:modification methylase